MRVGIRGTTDVMKTTIRAALWLALVPFLPAQANEALLRHNCGACHGDPANPEAPLSRISEQRKSPEGWEMTLQRMQTVHGVQFSDPEGKADASGVLFQLVKHLSDTHGLAPAETAGFRYTLERRHNTVDVPEDAEYAVMCTRCHSNARVALQRRTEPEWRNLIHFHLAQFPTTEYQIGGRDRQWFPIALERTLPMLAAAYPLQTTEWAAWQQTAKPALAGRWRVTGRMPGKGDFDGVMTAEVGDADSYSVALTGTFSTGEALEMDGHSVVYTGFEWRANLEGDAAAGGPGYLQVLEASADGSTLSGRMFPPEHPERGIDIQARRDDGTPRLLAVSPAQLKRGGTSTIRLSGSALSGVPALGQGIRVLRTLSRDADSVVLEVSADADAAVGVRDLAVGKSALPAALTVFDNVDRVEVWPAYSVGRVGGNGGSQPEVQGRFEAIAWADGPDGQANTTDDLRIGPVKATWSVAPWNEKAAEDRDVEFAGSMDKDTGVFTPAAAGPNPARKQSTNNAGNLKVIATVGEGEAALSGEAQLLVTVQRWINPPLW